MCFFLSLNFKAQFKPLKRNTSGDIYHDIRKLSNDVFCRKETLPMHLALVSMSRPLHSTPNSVSFSTWNCGQDCLSTSVYSA